MKHYWLKFLICFLIIFFFFLFGFASAAEAGCSEMYRFTDWDGLCPGYCVCVCFEYDPRVCEATKCIDNNTVVRYSCYPYCGGICGGCFVEGTEINTEQESKRAGEQEGIEKIENLEPGDIVSSFNPETGEISESQVSEVHKITREGYYELETESGKKVKVTAEHPFLAVKSEENLISKFKNALSNTLTFRLITGLQAKLVEILD